ncbi:MAG: hypothetical protein ACYCW5_02855 [Thermoleophilia bacterium]
MNEKDEALKCWQLRPNCMMRHQSRQKASCPAFRESKGCWEIDWKSIVARLDASQRTYWLSFLNNCENCIAYKNHTEEMQARIDAVKSLVYDD